LSRVLVADKSITRKQGQSLCEHNDKKSRRRDYLPVLKGNSPYIYAQKGLYKRRLYTGSGMHERGRRGVNRNGDIEGVGYVVRLLVDRFAPPETTFELLAITCWVTVISGGGEWGGGGVAPGDAAVRPHVAVVRLGHMHSATFDLREAKVEAQVGDPKIWVHCVVRTEVGAWRCARYGTGAVT
jgi:hypothetical protein